jgi:tetratricopeptide (TPR) repeat protein
MSSILAAPDISGPSRSTAFFNTTGKRAAVLSLLLAIATIALYFPLRHAPFLNFDDNDYVYQNLHVRSGLSLATVKWAFTTRHAANYHPLTWISHALDCSIFGINGGGPHVVNILLHTLSTILLFWILLQATGFLGRSLMVAALFALHPINVESVAWIAERKTMLSTVCFLLALAAYRWYVSKPRWTRYIVVAGLFGVGLLCKPQIITFPCVLLLWDYWPLRRMSLFKADIPSPDSALTPAFPQRSLFRLIVEKIPLFLICLVSAGVTMKVQHAARPSYWPYTFQIRIENAIVSYLRYIGKAFWPSNLAVLYPHPGKLLPTGEVLAALLLLLVITTLVCIYHRFRYLPVGWFWFLGMLVPMIGIIQVGRQSMADRYAYNAFIGLFLMICWGVAELARKVRVPVPVLAGASLAVLLSLAVVARRQIDLWTSPLLLWEHSAQVTTGNWVAEDMLAEKLAELGRVPDAMPYFYHANSIVPSDWISNMGIGIYLQRTHRYTEALEHFKVVIKSPEAKNESKMQAYDYMASTYRGLGDQEQAANCLRARQQLALEPER